MDIRGRIQQIVELVEGAKSMPLSSSVLVNQQEILELLDAHRTLSTARVRQAVLDAAVREAEIELEFVSGWEVR